MKEIYSRRSIRKYKDQPVDSEHMKQILRAGMYAPSAGNERPCHYIVVENRETLNQITTFHPFTQMLKEAPAAIVVCADMEVLKYDGMFWIQDVAASVQNILLEAESIGLGTCWCGIYPNEDFVNRLSELLNLPAHIIPAACIAIGHPDEKREVKERYSEDRVHQDKW